MFRTAGASPALIQSDSSNFPVGTTIHVDFNNNIGMEDGTFTYPFNTIQEGINVAGVDDLVGVAPGTYYELVILKAGVELVGADPNTTIIDGSGWGTVVTMGDASLLKGLTSSTVPFEQECHEGSPTIKNNIIQNNAQTAGGAGPRSWNASSPLIANNIIRGNTVILNF
jgi:hypothetical protein